MDNGICAVHPERHEFTPDCVQWDGSEETRLREESAALKGWAERAFAAESALAEARGALEQIAPFLSPNKTGVPFSAFDAASSAVRAALVRAGEQEAGACAEGEKAVQGEPASSGQDWMATCAAAGCKTRVLGAGDHCYRHYATPPPGEQGKGGGEGREIDLHRMLEKATVRIEILLARMRGCDDEVKRGDRGDTDGHALSLFEGDGWIEEQRGLLLSTAIRALAPAQPAEHPASRDVVCDLSLTPHWRDGHEDAHGNGIDCENPHPASGGEEK